MPVEKPAEITQLVNHALSGQADARAELAPLIYRELKKIAASLVLEPGRTLTSTVLVHEAFRKLFGEAGYGKDAARVQDRKHFYALAAQAMRQIQIDDFRARNAEKRFGGQTRVDLEDVDVPAPASVSGGDLDLLALDEALNSLAEAYPRSAKLVELRYFGGLTLPEVAEILDLSLATAKREWAFAKAWLYRTMTADGVGIR